MPFTNAVKYDLLFFQQCFAVLSYVLITFSYIYTGKLRPAELSDKRIVPDTIPRPDYADHAEGYPVSEMRLKGNTYIRQACLNFFDVSFQKRR